jgi:uncharacterized glyoxalase superfamily protein PhnB
MSRVKSISPTLSVEDPAKSREFYRKYFDAEVVFDAGMYIVVSIDGCHLHFMKPEAGQGPLFDGKGVTYNMEVEEVDKAYSRLTQAGLRPVMPLEDHPWGDRGFSVTDPNGVSLYIFTPTKPSEEYKQYFK